MRILVTGGAGFIGSNLALELERQGHDVVVVDDFSVGNYQNLKGFKGDVIAADVVSSNDWVYRAGAIDAVFHEAAITDTTVTDQKKMMQVNVEAFRNVLYFAAESGIKRVIYASSAGIYGSGACPMKESQESVPNNIYGFSKQVMERVAAAFRRDNPNINVIGLRYFNVYGPRESFKDKAASMIWQLSGQIISGKQPRIFKWGDQFRDFIYVKDVVKANILALTADANGAFNVCTGKQTTFNRIIEVLNQVLGTSVKTEYFDNPYSFYQNETLGDPTIASNVLKFRAEYSIEQGIRDYLGGSQDGYKGLPMSEKDKTIRLSKTETARL